MKEIISHKLVGVSGVVMVLGFYLPFAFGTTPLNSRYLDENAGNNPMAKEVHQSRNDKTVNAQKENREFEGQLFASQEAAEKSDQESSPEYGAYVAPQPVATIVVTTTRDSVYGYIQNKNKPCSLREAIHAVNQSTGKQKIVFKLPKTDAGYHAGREAWIFTFKQLLPVLKTNETVIDGIWGQVSKPMSIHPNMKNARRPVIELNGKGIKRGLLIQGDRNTIKGLAIYNFDGPGIRIEGSGNILVSNFIGTNSKQHQNVGNVNGVVIRVKGANNRIGKPGMGNLISGNKNNGIMIHGNVTNTGIESNFIGVQTDGFSKLPNGTGIALQFGAYENKIGGQGRQSQDKCDKGCNVISGNKFGIRINESDKNTVVGSFIGVGADGKTLVSNGRDGIVINSSHKNRIGGGLDKLRNVISGNRDGIVIRGSQKRKSVLNRIEGNFIGVNISGRSLAPNRQSGIYFTTGSENNTVGGSYNQGNVIGGNKNAGILIDNRSSKNKIYNNWIGISKTEVQAKYKSKGKAVAPAIMGNGQGVALYRGAQFNRIGGSIEHANVIAYNIGDGIHVEGTKTINNGLAANSIHHNGGKGISLVAGGNGTKHPWLRIWEQRHLGGDDYYLVGQIDPNYPNYQISCYADELDEGHYLEVSSITPDAVRVGWFGCKVRRHGNNNFTFTISDNQGRNTSEFLVSAKPTHVGTWPFDMDYWEIDPDNLCPKNPHHHGGWGNFPPRKKIRAEFKKQAPWYKVSQFKRGFTDIPGVAHNVFATYNWWNTCMYSDGSFAFFMNYATPALFTGRIFWESYVNKVTCEAGDQDNNFGLLTPPGTGVNINTQRYFDLNPSLPVSERIVWPGKGEVGGVGSDARDWPDPKWKFIQKELKKRKSWVPILTLEIDRCDGFDKWKKHPFWGWFRNPGFGEGLIRSDADFEQAFNNKKAIVIGFWTMDCAHECRSEVHPVLGLAIQDEAPKSSTPTREVWHFFARNKSNQAYCGEEINIGSTHPDWYFRFPGRPGPCKISTKNGYAHEEDPNSVHWKVYRSGNDVVVKAHLPDEDDWLIGTVIINWP